MPIYDFKCPSCGEVREVIQRHDAAAPECVYHPTPVAMERQLPRGTLMELLDFQNVPGHRKPGIH